MERTEMLKALILAAMVLLLVIRLNEASRAITPHSQTVAVNRFNDDHARVELSLRRLRMSEVGCELTVHNVGQKSFFIMTAPQRSDATMGPYFGLNSTDSSTLEINIKIYPPSPYDLVSNHAAVKLLLLEPRASHTEKFTIRFPLLETMPPYGKHPTRQIIRLSETKHFQAFIGILPDEEGITNLLHRKPAGPFIHGLEQIKIGAFKDKHLIELQTVVFSSRVSL
jgi:hypothetical protein